MTGPEQTYLALLLLPHNLVRTQMQSHLAGCRDAIALATDQSAEEVQNKYERLAEALKGCAIALTSAQVDPASEPPDRCRDCDSEGECAPGCPSRLEADK